MIVKLKACVYSQNEGVVPKNIDMKQLEILGYECLMVSGDIDELFKHFNENIVNVLILEDDGTDLIRFERLVNLIYDNYCKNIIVVGNKQIEKSKKYYLIDKTELSNFDLKLAELLLMFKSKIMQKPAYSIQKVKSAVHELLVLLKFSPKNSGFTYFVDAITITFFNYPKHINIMDIYQEIGDCYGIKLCAVERAMRTALANAIKEVQRLPDTNQNKSVKDFVKYDLTNSILIKMILGKLLTDTEFGEELYSRI